MFIDKNDLNDIEKHNYWNGWFNRGVRGYYYIEKGLELVNAFRYLIMGIIATYAILKMDNPLIMIAMFLVALPVLMSLGWLLVHKMQKRIEFINIRFSTHYGRYNINLQERQTAALEKLVELIGEKREDV